MAYPGPTGEVPRRRPSAALVLVVVGAGLGLLFSAFSTYDFAQHLDRQVHGVHCSFLPGLTGTETGTSGCQEVMMSSYSSFLRAKMWGGIPISLAAMSVFAFLVFFAGEIALSGRQGDPRATGFLALATALPAAASAVMAFISLHEIGATCKLCIGVYVASALCLAGGLWLWRQAASVTPSYGYESGTYEERTRPVAWQFLAGAFAAGVVGVVLPVAAWSASAPDHARFVGACGGLEDPSDPYGTLIPFSAHPGGAPAIEVLDPLCPACRAFERRLAAAELTTKLDRRATLFPLDNTCNWMVKSAIHPGACMVSEAVLCAGSRADDVVAWAFEHQEQIRTAAASDPRTARQMVTARFPDLASCLGSAEVRSRLNKSLRWAVRNHLAVLTPQLYVGGVRLCDEDVDLGLDFALSRMIEQQRAGTLKPPPPPASPAPAARPPRPPRPRPPTEKAAAEPAAEPAASPTTPPPQEEAPEPAPEPAKEETPEPAKEPTP